MPWTWDPNKDAENVQKHQISFDTAQLVFNDLYYLIREDHYENEQRWQTFGAIGDAVIIVVHTWPERGQPGRIITARRASRYERRLYEEGQI